jgi:hypothetical protein
MGETDDQLIEDRDSQEPPLASDPPEPDDHAAESERLGGRPALRTMLILAAGPLLSNITNSLYGIVDSIWVQRAVGDKGMTAISTYNLFELIAAALAFGSTSARPQRSAISTVPGEGTKPRSSCVI